MPEFVESAEFLHQSHWPISKHRAQSHVLNPRADKEDVALIVAYQNNMMVGYIGALPDYLMIPNNQTKIAWLSCWWVAPNMRKTGLGKQLLDAIIAAYEKRVILTEFTDAAERVYSQHIDLERLRPLRGYKYYFKSIAHKKVAKGGLLRHVGKPLLKIADAFVNLIWANRTGLKPFEKLQTRMVELDNVNDLDEFFQPFMQRNIFKRKVNSLNWIKNNPWVLNEPFDIAQKRKYFFTSSAKKFFCRHYVLYDKDQNVETYCMIVFNEGKLKVPYLFAKGGTIGEIADFLWHLAAKEKAEELTFYHKFLGDYLQNIKYPAFAKKETNRQFYAGNFISWYFNDESDITIADGDGDCAFL